MTLLDQDLATRIGKRVLARREVARAIREARLIRGPCEKCGAAPPTDAHHADYDRPLDVTWLCRRCHLRLHADEPRPLRQRPRLVAVNLKATAAQVERWKRAAGEAGISPWARASLDEAASR